VAKYIKKPIEVEAIQFVDDSYGTLCAIGSLGLKPVVLQNPLRLEIQTLEGIMYARLNDYIIKGINGEFYPCKPDIFEKTYMRRENIGEITDGSHSFNELYYHRMILFSIICNDCSDKAWKSWKHHDNTMFDNYFIVGIDTPKGQYSYHYHKDYWGLFDVKEIEFAPVWDGHQPKDVTRLLSL